MSNGDLCIGFVKSFVLGFACKAQTSYKTSTRNLQFSVNHLRTKETLSESPTNITVQFTSNDASLGTTSLPPVLSLPLSITSQATRFSVSLLISRSPLSRDPASEAITSEGHPSSLECPTKTGYLARPCLVKTDRCMVLDVTGLSAFKFASHLNAHRQAFRKNVMIVYGELLFFKYLANISY